MPTMTRTRVHAHAGSTAGTARKVGDEGPLGCHSEPLQDPPQLASPPPGPGLVLVITLFPSEKALFPAQHFSKWVLESLT